MAPHDRDREPCREVRDAVASAAARELRSVTICPIWTRPEREGTHEAAPAVRHRTVGVVRGGVVQLFDGRIAHTGVAAVGAVAVLLTVRGVVAVRKRWRRVRSWRRPGEADAFRPGPRRVLLVETGLAAPR